MVFHGKKIENKMKKTNDLKYLHEYFSTFQYPLLSFRAKKKEMQREFRIYMVVV